MNKKRKIILKIISKCHEIQIFSRLNRNRFAGFLIGASLTYVISASAINNYKINPVAQADGNNTLYYPFGMITLQPPDPANVITIKAGIGVTAKQVCGYTDWSSAALVLPTQLLSADYWKGVSKDLQNQATQLVISLSGALPGMLACNVSPTFCHVLNVAQEMAQQEFQFTANTCKMLDGVADALPKNSALASCIQNTLANHIDGITDPGRARERCIVSDSGGDDYNSKLSNVSNKSGGNLYGFDSSKILNSVCPEVYSSTFSGGLSSNYRSGTHTYSQIQETCVFAKELFPGFDVTATGRVSQAGTFQATVSSLVEKNQKQLSEDIMVVVRGMYSSYRQGKTPSQVMSDVAGNWSKSTMASQKRAPLYLRNSSDGSDPQFLIPPQQMYQLTQLVDPTLKARSPSPQDIVEANYKSSASPFKQALDRIVGTSSYISVLDSMNDLRSRVLDACSSSSDLQVEAAQENCKMMQSKLQAQMQYLQTRIEAEQSVIAMQKDVNNYVQSIISQKNNVQTGSLPLEQFNNNSNTKIDPAHM